MSEGTSLVPVDRIERAILLLRGQKVLLDEDLAELYEVETKRLNEAVKRNIERFPADFMFQLTPEEFENLRSQFATSRCYDLSEKSHALPWGGRRNPPYAFTEQGVAMLSSVLRSPRAVQVNIEIMRAFVRLRQFLASHEELARKVAEMDKQLQMVTAVVWTLFAPDESEARKACLGSAMKNLTNRYFRYIMDSDGFRASRVGEEFLALSVGRFHHGHKNDTARSTFAGLCPCEGAPT